MNWILDPILPLPTWSVIGLVLLGVAIFASWQVSRHLSMGKRAFLLALRVIAVAALWILALRPSVLEPIQTTLMRNTFAVLVDRSASMAQRDTKSGSRFDEAMAVLSGSRLSQKLEAMGWGYSPLFFDENLQKVPLNNWSTLRPEGDHTRMDDVFDELFDSGEHNVKGILVLSDGHDLSGLSPARVIRSASKRRVPVHTWPIGKQGKVRDAGVERRSFPPYVHVGQRARMRVTVYPRGLEYESLDVQLLREGVLVQTKKIQVEERLEVPVSFNVKEERSGQVEYVVRVLPLQGESTLENNSTTMYLNTVEKEIQVLLLEGEPYWDTTFLQRSIMANDKFDVDVITHYAGGRLRRIRKKSRRELHVPQEAHEWKKYDVVILGRSLETFMTRKSFESLATYVKRDKGTVIFCRAIDSEKSEKSLRDLHPAYLLGEARAKVSLRSLAEGQHLSVLAERLKLEENPDVPRIIAARSVRESKRLVSVLAEASDPSGEREPALLYRRLGSGQVLSVGLDGLWRWAFHNLSEVDDNAFHDFWDQTLVWLVAGGQKMLDRSNRIRLERSNLGLGERLNMSLNLLKELESDKSATLSFFHEDKLLEKRSVRVPKKSKEVKDLSFQPAKPGRYRVEGILPDGTQVKARFVVSRDNRERLEVEADGKFLRAMSKASGGRVITSPKELDALLDDIVSKKETKNKFRKHSLWDRLPIFLMLVALLGSEWFLRRRWGLA